MDARKTDSALNNEWDILARKGGKEVVACVCMPDHVDTPEGAVTFYKAMLIRDEAHAAEHAAAANRLAQFPNLEPDRFWFMVRVSGYEQAIKDWVTSMANPGSEAEPNPAYDPVGAALVSAKLEFAKHFERDHPFIVEAMNALGIPEAELDALWQFAASG